MKIINFADSKSVINQYVAELRNVLQLAYEALCTKGTPKHLHLCCVIASKVGVENVLKMFKPLDNVTLWCAAIDPILNEHKYIVPGLGDAGDLAYGDKI